jgi:hypothetical protein
MQNIFLNLGMKITNPYSLKLAFPARCEALETRMKEIKLSSVMMPLCGRNSSTKTSFMSLLTVLHQSSWGS